jgi:hypothetical protein
MNRAETRHDDEDLATAPDLWSLRARHLIAMQLVAARGHAEAGRLDAARECLIGLRVELVGGHPDDEEGLLRHARAACYRHDFDHYRPSLNGVTSPTAPGEAAVHPMPIADRNDWLQASQLSGQAIAELGEAMASGMDSSLHRRSTTLAEWETRHRDRVGRWIRTAMRSTKYSPDYAVDKRERESGGPEDLSQGLARAIYDFEPKKLTRTY